MKIAITGGAGFIGSHLTKAYLNAGHDVLVIDNLSHGSRAAIDTRARFYQVDIRDEKLHTILQLERPDVVSHHAVQQHQLTGEQSLMDADVHIRGLINVLDGCIAAAVRKFVFASGGNTLYGRVDVDRLPLTEDTPLCPQRAYDISKVAGEWYVRNYSQQHGLKHTILRYADVYGETDSTLAHHPLSYFTSALLEQRRPVIRGASDVLQDHIFIEDVARANVSVIQHGDNQTLHISSGRGSTLNQLYRVVAYILNSELEPVYLSSHSAIEPTSIVLDNTRAQRVLGWRPEANSLEKIRLAVKRLQPPQEPVSKQETILEVAASIAASRM